MLRSTRRPKPQFPSPGAFRSRCRTALDFSRTPVIQGHDAEWLRERHWGLASSKNFNSDDHDVIETIEIQLLMMIIVIMIPWRVGLCGFFGFRT